MEKTKINETLLIEMCDELQKKGYTVTEENSMSILIKEFNISKILELSYNTKETLLKDFEEKLNSNKEKDIPESAINEIYNLVSETLDKVLVCKLTEVAKIKCIIFDAIDSFLDITLPYLDNNDKNAIQEACIALEKISTSEEVVELIEKIG